MAQEKSAIKVQEKSLIQNLINIQCFGKNKAIQFCLSQQCKQKHIFTCFNKQCQCHKQHKKCQRGYIDYALQTVRNKILQTKLINEEIQKIVNIVIDEISQFRDKLLIKVEENMKFTQLGELQKIFMNLVQKNQKPELFSTVESKKLWNIIHEEIKQKSTIFDATKIELNNFLNRQKTNIQNMSKFVDQKLKDFQNYQKSLQMKRRNISINQRIVGIDFQNKSAIIKTQEMAVKLTKFFPKQLKKAQLLFKASQHNFSIAKFYQKCGTVPGLMIVCITNKDKIIGGYSPFCHDNGKTQWQPDQTKNSFIFSLSNNDKFDLKNTSYALYRNTSKTYIYIGAQQFYICDTANTKNDCRSVINSYYINPSYLSGDKSSFLRLNGNQTYQFTTKQWQAWKIELQA